jgi:CSLREA domain-containing protein
MKLHFTFRFNWCALAALLAALVGSTAQVTPVYAASIVVTSNGDTIANDGVCTLREALIAAQQNAPAGGCAGGSSIGVDIITFVGNYTITLGSQLPFVTTAITINGKGAANTIIQSASSPNVATWRIFQVTSTGNLTLNQMTVRNGRCNGSCTVLGNIEPNAGGAIYNGGTLTVTNSTIADNTADNGGGLYNSGTLTVTNSVFSGNNANGGYGRGGGIYNNGTLSVTNSTFSGNVAAFTGGGIFSEGVLNVKNSTFSGNRAAGSGGGIHNNGTLDLANSTLVGNITNFGGGLFNGGTATVTNSTIAGNIADFDGGGIDIGDGSVVTFRNTIIANNEYDECSDLTSGIIVDGGSNLVHGSPNQCNFQFLKGSLIGADPKLGPLANNGGPTQTMALLADSPAVDNGRTEFCSVSPINGMDQRGVSRPQGVFCDIGAYEYNGSFSDVPPDFWAWDFVERLYAAGITGGCASSPLSYCPEGTVTRAQMAVFLLRGIHGASYAPPGVGAGTGFGDVPPSYWAATFIMQLAAEGITTGCGGGFCPEGAVTRAQMAVFLLRAKYGSAYTPPAVGTSTGFSDVPTTYWAAAFIKQLVAEGITVGCGSGNYCPEQPVTRAQMAVFLVRTFTLP